MALAIGLGFLGGRATAASGAAATPAAARIVVVRPGDTVWAIARRLVGPQADPRFMVEGLIQRNGLRDAVVRAGERLAVPDA